MNGRFDHSWVLEVESIVMSVPMPGGHLLIPRLLSNATAAPLLGEAGVLYNLTRKPLTNEPVKNAVKALPGVVWIVLLIELGLGAFFLKRGGRCVRRGFEAIREFRKWMEERELNEKKLSHGSD